MEHPMPQAPDQDEKFDDQDQNVSDLDVAGFAILSPTQALLVSALSASDPERHGYYVDDGFEIILPCRNWQALGFCPSREAPVESGVNTYRLLFKAVAADGKQAYWSFLFPEAEPEIVFEFQVDRESGVSIVSISDGWLEWPWWLSKEERLEYLVSAQQAYEQLFDEINWLELVKQSATTGPKSALFEGVAKHLAAQFGVNDTL